MFRCIHKLKPVSYKLQFFNVILGHLPIRCLLDIGLETHIFINYLEDHKQSTELMYDFFK